MAAPRSARMVLASGAVLVAAAACSADDDAGPGPTTATPEVSVTASASSVAAPVSVTASASSVAAPVSDPSTSDGMRPIEGDGYAIGVPAAWSVHELRATADVPADAVTGSTVPAALRNVAVAAGLQGGRLFAVTGGSADATMLLAELGPDTDGVGASVSDAVRQRLAEQGLEAVEVRTVEVAGLPAARATFQQTEGDGRRSDGIVVYVPGPVRSWVLTFGLPAPADADALGEVDAVVASFRPT